jgi:glycosyltransferase involved in cell wall biosynthesis
MLPDSSERGCVSVVVPTYNSAKSLHFCLAAIRRQKYPSMEVLVVDNYSDDDTRSVAKTFSANVILHRGTQAAARNVGCAHSKGGYVLFVDSDQQLNDGVIENCVRLCSEFAVDAVKIPEVFLGLNFWGKCSALWKNSAAKAGGLKGGIPRFYRKQVLPNQLAFSDELRWWDDLELYQRLISAGLREAWCSGQVIHYEADSLRNVVRKYFSYGYSITAFKRNHVKAPYAATFRLTLSTMVQMLKDPGRSLGVFSSCVFLVSVKSMSAALGLLSRLR